MIDLTKRYFIIGKYNDSNETEYIIGRNDYTDNNGVLRKGFFAERYKIPKDKKKAEKFYLEYSHSREDAEKILKQYRRYNPKHCISSCSWYHKPITYLKRASKGFKV